ncbi:MAG: arginine repressor [Clostridia bacterium]|nr:arginine repressor [Clostridia bacterium]
MMHRNARQQKILEIIATKEIDTQEELCSELNKLNFNVTQATISRDIKDLRLYKITGTTKKYKYACLDSDDDSVSGRMKNLFRECVQTITYANNIIVVKTMRGNGSTAGTFVDSLQIKEIIGSVAGDDTLLIVVDNNEDTPVVAEKLREYII